MTPDEQAPATGSTRGPLPSWSPWTLALALVLVTTPWATTQLVEAHTGSGNGVTDLGDDDPFGYLEGEAFAGAPPECDPDYDSEHTKYKVHNANWASGEGVVFLPHSGCWVQYSAVTTSVPLQLEQFRVGINGEAEYDQYETATYTVSVAVDGSQVASRQFTMDKHDHLVNHTFPSEHRLPAGTHDIQVKYTVDDGMKFQNLRLDHLAFEDRCLNSPPTLEGIGADGLLDGLLGWHNRSYTFDADVSDPDGDPVDVTWDWSDGTELTGQQVSRSFDLGVGDLSLSDLDAEVVTGKLSIVDDPSERCPDVPYIVEETVGQVEFLVVPTLTVANLDLLQGLSCHAGEFVATEEISIAGDLIADTCSLDVTADTNGAPSDIVDEVMLVTDGDPAVTTTDPKITDDGVASTLSYDAADVPDGEHTLRACATAVNDTHDRLFCSSPYEYTDVDCTNAGPSIGGVSADGMLDGMTGWAGYEYTFEASTSDPDGDPVSVTWTWPNGEQAHGETASNTFHGVGDHPAEVTVTEDTSQRCPELKPLSATTQPTFETVEGDWVVELDKPLTKADWSCLAAEWVPTAPTAPNTAFGRCPVEAHVENVDVLDSSVEGAFELVDVRGRPVVSFGADSGTAVSASYESLEYPSQQLRLDACFQAADDKHDREFCSGEYTFFNVGASLD